MRLLRGAVEVALARGTAWMKPKDIAVNSNPAPKRFGTPGFRAWAAHRARDACWCSRDATPGAARRAAGGASRSTARSNRATTPRQVYEWMAVAHKALGDDEPSRRRLCHRGEHLRTTRRRAGTSLQAQIARRPDDARRSRSSDASRGGATNKQVAEQICISEKTVEPASGQHLRQTRCLVAHRGSGVGARKQLAVASFCIICTISDSGICMVCPDAAARPDDA